LDICLDLEIGILVILCWIVTGIVLLSCLDFCDNELDKTLNICVVYVSPGHFCIWEDPFSSNANSLLVYVAPVVLRVLLIWCV
jgi:hypothetical protein